MDFITHLPEVDGFNAILVFTDKLSKMVHFVPTTNTCTAQLAAVLFLANVVRLHGVPKQVVSDRDPRWHSTFYQTFNDLIGVQHSFSTAFHPETDGQTERVNRVLEDYLRHFVDPAQTNWPNLLPTAEFAYNNSFHEAIQTTPFRLNYGIDPLTPWSLLSQSQAQNREVFLDHSPDAKKFSVEMQEALNRAKLHLDQSRQRQKHFADKLRSDAPQLEVGSEVLLSTKNLAVKHGKSKKLLPRFIGPFTVTTKINEVAYKLHLPHQYRIHDVFHVSLLKPYKPKPGERRPPLPDIIDSAAEFEVEKILDHFNKKVGKKKEVFYLIKWQGYSDEYNTWEPASNLTNCPLVLHAYWSKVGGTTSCLGIAGQPESGSTTFCT